MLPWQQLDGIDDAVSLLQQALADGRRIMVVGDFDADGATSTALTVLALLAWAAPASTTWCRTALKTATA